MRQSEGQAGRPWPGRLLMLLNFRAWLLSVDFARRTAIRSGGCVGWGEEVWPATASLFLNVLSIAIVVTVHEREHESTPFRNTIRVCAIT